MMWIHTCAKGSRAYALSENFGKNVAICRILSVPKYVIINLKINNFKDNISTIIIKKIAIPFSNINPDEHVDMYI